MNLLGHPLFSSFWLIQVLDVALITYIVWLLLRAIWGQPVMRVIVAIVLVWGVSVLLNFIGFYSIGFITGKLASVSIFALIVIFSQEVKTILTRFGRYLSEIRFFDFKHDHEEQTKISSIEAVLETCNYLREFSYGGLMIFVRNESIDAHCTDPFHFENIPATAGFLESFLTPPGPYHDGAIVIHNNKIIMARAILELAELSVDTVSLGTRHRAAKGIVNKTDALVVIVSEETGRFRLAYDGKLTSSYNMETLRKNLYQLMRAVNEKETNEK